jgi:hypothetical protein
MIFSLAILTASWAVDGGTSSLRSRTIFLPLTHTLALRVYPLQSEGDELKVRLESLKTGALIGKLMRVPVTFTHIQRAICAEYKQSGIWLVLGTEDTVADSLSFCLAVNPTQKSLKLLLDDHSGVEEKSNLLHRGIFREDNIKKWIFPDHVNAPDSNELWSRKGVFDPKKLNVAFGPWKRKKSSHKLH